MILTLSPAAMDNSSSRFGIKVRLTTRICCAAAGGATGTLIGTGPAASTGLTLKGLGISGGEAAAVLLLLYAGPEGPPTAAAAAPAPMPAGVDAQGARGA